MAETDHRIKTCTKQTTCEKGFEISPTSSTEVQTCSECGADTFGDGISCNPHITCGRGESISAQDSREQSTCFECLPNTYQTLTGHRKQECTVQPTCGIGERISPHSNVERQTCSECPQNMYNVQSSHRNQNCTEQPRCDPGFKISAPSLIEKQRCNMPCAENTYIDVPNHRIQNCTIQPTCDPGYKISAKSKTKLQTCMPCGNVTYMDETAHRKENCKIQPLCSTGFNTTGSATKRAECNPVQVGSSAIDNPGNPVQVGSSVTDNPGSAAGGAAGSVVALLLIAAAVALVISRRNTAQRAKAALLGAEAIFSIPCGNTECADPRCSQSTSNIPVIVVAAATPPPPSSSQSDLERCSTCKSKIQFCMCSGSTNDKARALTLATATQGQMQCIQKTSTGTLCTAAAIAGSNRCINHTCEHGDCARPKKTKDKTCPKHKNAVAIASSTPNAVMNPAFTGVLMLDSSVGSLDNSSTDVPHTLPALTLSKFVAMNMVLGDSKLAAFSFIKLMGVDERTYKDLTEEKAIQKVVSEFKESAVVEHQEILKGLIDGTYCNPGTTTPLPSLAEIMSTMELARLKKYGLQSHHALAIRLYTTVCHEPINAPLRTHDKPHPQLPHPFAATMYYIADGLRKLLVASGDDHANSSTESILWRGVSNVGIADDFKSGTEMACMSTSESPTEALNFTDDQGFMFHIVCNDYTSKGQSIGILSVYPHEKEVLYPPLTYLNIDTGSQEVNRLAQIQIDKITSARNLKPIKVVTVRPTYPKE